MAEPSNICECDCNECKKQNNTDCCCNRACEKTDCKWCEEWAEYDDNMAKQEINELYAECDKYVERMKTELCGDLPVDLAQYTTDNKISKDKYYHAMAKYIHKYKLYSLVEWEGKGYDYIQFERQFNAIEWYEFMNIFNPTKKHHIPLSYQYYINKTKHNNKKGKCEKCYNVRELIPLECSVHWHCHQCYKIVDDQCWECRHNNECNSLFLKNHIKKQKEKEARYTLV